MSWDQFSERRVHSILSGELQRVHGKALRVSESNRIFLALLSRAYLKSLICLNHKEQMLQISSESVEMSSE